MINIMKFCKYLYNATYIPIYLYNDNELTTCYPNQEKYTLPPSHYISKLLDTNQNVTYTITSFYSYYGCIKIQNSSSHIIIGPINDFAYSKDTLMNMRKEFFVDISNMKFFCDFFCNIPTLNLDIFLNILLFVNFTINNTELTRTDIENSKVTQFDSSLNHIYTQKNFEEKDYGYINCSYEVESELVRYIETGNLVGINNFMSRDRNITVGTIANNNLIQWKNILIVATTLASRAAMKGGLPANISYNLSNIYMQQAERLSDLDAIQGLLSQVFIDYTNRVANSIIPSTADNILYTAIQYIRENTNKHITVADVADYVGYTRPSLSRKFKKEIGFEVSSFIRKCKLEDSKDLLAFSNKSISEISSYLCFSSQSHFQNAFKKHFGITPQTFRKAAKSV